MTLKKPNKSYFLSYIRYNLKTNRVQIIVFAIMNFIILLLPYLMNMGLFFKVYNHIKRNDFSFIIQDLWTSFFISVRLIIIALMIAIIMFTIISAKSFKYYYNRAMMDTLGCLPLSYKERFWGDYLSGLLVNMISFVPFGVISLIMTIISAPFEKKILNYSNSKEIMPSNFMNVFITVFLTYIAIHAITVFVTSCCGKLSSSIVYSFVTMLILPGIFTSFGLVGYSEVLGINMLNEISERVGMFPPFGWIFSEILKEYGLYYVRFQLYPSNIIIFVLITAMFILGAYFVGRRRKADRVEQGFVFKGAYRAISLGLITVMIGFTVFYFLLDEINAVSVFKAAGLPFGIYLALELSNSKSFKGLWRSVIRYVCVFGASFGFLFLMRSTHGFGLQNRLPSVNSISEIRFSGDYFYEYYINRDQVKNTIINKNSIASVIEEHRKLLDNSDKLTTLTEFNMLEITYVTNNGQEITRSYSCDNDSELIKEFSENVKKLGFDKRAPLGFLDDPVYENLEIHCYVNGNKHDMPPLVIREDKEEEFADILKNDILNFYNSNRDGNIGDVYFRTENHTCPYSICSTYKDTIAFLENPENFGKSEVTEEKSYHVKYKSGDDMKFIVELYLIIYPDSKSNAVKRFLELVEIINKDEVEKYSEIYIQGRPSCYQYGVKKEDELEMRKVLMEIFRENNAH